ncbi:GNAT family N-acetyltransferase [Paludibacterium paludis]|nr:GNAT family N-acetyltransferase [Paludibacterium paludis]
MSLDETVLAHAESHEGIAASFPLMRELRPHLNTPEEYVEQILRQQASGYHLLLAWRDGVVTGLAGYREQENLVYGRFLYIDDLVTLPSLRGAGLGARLLAACQEEAARRGCRKLVLDTRRDNVLAQRFYFRNGMLPHVMRFSRDLV